MLKLQKWIWLWTLVLGCVASSRAETLYLFVSDRAPNPARTSSIHRYAIDSARPGVLAPAPSAGQTGTLWGNTVGKKYQGMRITDMVVASNGDVYATCRDTNSVIRFDGKTGEDKGEIAVGLRNPDSIAIGPDGNFYVANDETIARFTLDGKPLPGDGQIGNIFAVGGRLKAASGLAFGPDGNLYVASQATGEILRFDGQSGDFLGVFYSGEIRAPSEIAFGPDGNLYVASTGGPGFNAESGFVAKIDGVTGKLLGKFAPEAKGALGLTFGANDDLYVTGYWTGQVSRYDAKTGKLLGVVAGSPVGSSLYYLALAKQETPTSQLQPVNIKLPARPKTRMKTSNQPGAATIKGWKNALAPKGTPGPTLTLASKKKSDYAIILPANATTMDQKAAALLALHLRQMTNAKLPIVTEGSGAKTGGKVISIGHTALLKKSDPKTFARDLGDEGYAVSAAGSTLFLVGGKTRGAIYAVYALLEEDLGFRWYASDGIASIPKRETLSFKPVLRHFVPPLDVRDPFYYAAFDIDWSLKNKTNTSYAPIPPAWGGSTANPPGYFTHTFALLLPPDKYFKEHPEYFAEVNGKRQPTQLELTNPEVLRLAIENVKETLRANPDAKIISVSPNDGRGYSESAASRAIDEAEATVPGSKSGTLLKFVNAVAEAIEPEFPNVKVSTLAYLDTFMPPKTIRPRKNVIIHLATDSHAWKYQFCFTTESHDFQTALKAWHAIGADIHIWDYTTSFVHYMVPMPNMPVVTDNIRFYIAHGAKGVMLQGAYQSPGGDRAPMRSWVWAKQLWNPELDTRALMRDFVFGYYGKAAQPMWDYNMMLWQMWQIAHATPHKHDGTKPVPNPLLINDAPCSAPPDWILLSPQYIEQSTQLFAQAEKLATDDITRRRVQLAKLSLLYVKLGQGLGYIEEFGNFVPGTWAKSRNAAEKPKFQALYDEFMGLAKRNNVTSAGELYPLEKVTEKWNALLQLSDEKLPVLPLSDTWQFKTDPEQIGIAQSWASTPDVAGWSEISSNAGNKGWEGQGFPEYRGYAWYRQNFSIPANFEKRKHLWLFFPAVDSESEIYLNGEKIFEHTLASTGLKPETIWNDAFFVDIAPHLQPGENALAVRVTSAGGVRGVWRPVSIISSNDALSADAMKFAIANAN
jgi:outer membrane protein assembly factor BamB